MAREVDLIKEKTDIVDLLRSYLTLLPAGKYFKALCPFHGEKTPSFIVSPERRTWHCFGCNIGGDAIAFLMKYENIEFPEALRVLAERAGITLERVNQHEQREFNVLYDIHESATTLFQDTLKKNIRAQEYLKGRGLDEETINTFQLGYAPGGETLVMHLLHAGYDMRDIVKAGLAHKNLQGLYRDRFYERVMFPITNSLGRVVAFTGRILMAKEGSDAPKYLNSPETPIFNKSKVLYGFDKAKGDILRGHTVVLVEGQMDFFAFWQSGVRNVVAVSGTALSEAHLEKLRRTAETIIIALDNDEAGFHALERALPLFHSFDFHIKALDLGIFKDPGEAVLKDKAFLLNAVEHAEPVFNYIFNHYFKGKEINDIAEKKRTIRHLIDMIRNIKSAVEQNEWLMTLARVSRIPQATLEEELRALPSSKTSKKEDVYQKEAEMPKERIHHLSRRLITLALTRDTFSVMLKEKQEYLPPLYRAILENPQNDARALFELEGIYRTGEAKEEEIVDEYRQLLHELELESLKKEQEALREKIRNAGGESEEDMQTLITQFDTISRKINTLNS